MIERKLDLRKQMELGEALKRGINALADSDRPDNRVLADLRMIGVIEQQGDGKGIFFKLLKIWYISCARSRMWTPEQIQEEINEGKCIELMTRGGQE